MSSSTARAQLPCLPSVGHHSCPSRHLVRGAGTRHRLGRNRWEQHKIMVLIDTGAILIRKLAKRKSLAHCFTSGITLAFPDRDSSGFFPTGILADFVGSQLILSPSRRLQLYLILRLRPILAVGINPCRETGSY